MFSSEMSRELNTRSVIDLGKENGYKSNQTVDFVGW